MAAQGYFTEVRNNFFSLKEKKTPCNRCDDVERRVIIELNAILNMCLIYMKSKFIFVWHEVTTLISSLQI